MNIEIIQQISISVSDSILMALKMMDKQKRKLLIVLENDKYKNIISIGDIQRAIIANISLSEPVGVILRDNTRVASVNDDLEQVKHFMRERRNEFMPVVDSQNNLTNVIFWEDLFNEKPKFKNKQFDLSVVIMAGGKGERLRPLTNVLPKPLIPIGKQTMLEDIMDRFVDYGCHNFFISVNYKADTIRRYLDNLQKPEYNVSFFQEKKPLGTAGSLHLLKTLINKTFFVSNCDIIVDADYSDILDYHRKNGNEITVVAAIKNYPIPYGTLETGKNGFLKSIYEKPEYTFKINTGMYILEPHLIEEIPEDQIYHITYLIETLISKGRKVGVYPISEGSWTDVGNWDEYMKFISLNKNF